MTEPRDQEMIDLLAQKTPADLSPEEVATLRAMMKRSAVVRAALAEEVGFEEALSATLAPPVADLGGAVDTIAQRARSRRRAQLVRVYGIAVVALFLVAAFATSRYWLPEPEAGDAVVAAGKQNPDPTGSNLAAAAPPEAAADGAVVGVDEGGDQTGEARPPRALQPLTPISAQHFTDPLTTEGVGPIDAIRSDFAPLGKAGWDTREDRGVGINGTYRLVEPLYADQLLRLSLGEYKPSVTVDLWDGKAGVRFVWDQRRWTAYQTTRDKPDAAEPTGLRRVAAGTLRGELHGTMPFDVSLLDGQAVVSRAGVRLIAAPFEAAAAQVDLTSDNRLYFVQRRRGVDVPRDVPPMSEPLAVGAWKAAEGVEAVRVGAADGLAAIEAEKSDGNVLAELPWPTTPAFDVRFDAGAAAVGTVFELRSADGKVIGRPVVIAQRDGRRIIAEGEDSKQIDRALAHGQTFGGRLALRYIGGLRGVVWQAGVDGVNWYTLGSAFYVDGDKLPTRLTVRTAPGEQPVRLVLGAADGQRYTALRRLRTTLDRPADTYARTGRDGLDDLSDALNAGVAGQAVALAMDELVWRAPAKDLDALMPALAQVVERAVRRELDAGRIDEAIDVVRTFEALHTPDDLSNTRLPRTAPWRAQRLLWYGLYDARQWDALEAAVLRAHAGAIRADGQPHDKEHGGEALALGRLMLDTARAQRGQPTLPLAGETAPALEHPLSLRGDRESETVMAEFQAAVDAGQLAQACRLLVSQTLGDSLVAVGSDAGLLRSSAFLVKQAMDEHPRIRQLLRSEYLDVGQLRVARAITAEDVEALESLSLQFHGMAPGVEATMFLADRDLALGRFLAAADRYATLLGTPGVGDPRGLAAKHRLAWAMLGEARGEPINGNVQLGDRAFRGRQFEDMIASLIKQSAGEGGSALPGNTSPLKPGKLREQELLNLGHEDTSGSLHIAGDRALILHKSFIDVIDLKAKTTRRVGDPKKPGPAEGHTPLLLEDGFVCRWRDGELRRFDNDGNQLWDTRVDGGVLSDPVLIGRWVYVLGRGRAIGRRTAINLNRIDVSNGAVVQSTRLIEVGSTRSLDAGAPLVTPRGLLFGLASTVVATDSSGQVVWVRRLPYVPESIDSGLYRERRGVTMALHDGRLTVAAEGSPEALGIDASTGKLLWRRALPDAGAARGMVGGVAVLDAPNQAVGIDSADGRVRWRLNIAGSHGTHFAATADQLLRVRATEPGETFVAWIDPATGEAREEPLPKGDRRRLHMLAPWAGKLVGVTRFDNGPARVIAIER